MLCITTHIRSNTIRISDINRRYRMICPKCNREINHVNLFRECCQECLVDVDGNIIDYGSVTKVLGITGAECPECYKDISVYITE